MPLPMPAEHHILELLHAIRHRLDDDVSLEALATRAGWSSSHFHRAFRRVVGETPKRYTQRLRLERAAARLASSDDPVLRIAADAGFASHAVFTRAFRRQFGRPPAAYRTAALRAAPPAMRARHLSLTDATSPCVGLYHVHPAGLNRPAGQQGVPMPMLSIERRELTSVHALIVRARCARHEISQTIAECLGKAYPYAIRVGAALDGRPFTRYLSIGPGLITMESGCIVATPSPGEGDVEATTLPGGPAVVAMHGGSYDTLTETYTEMERWMEKQGVTPGGAPWESYITDPADHPDPADWRTEIYWPLK